jgi:hypothetical protein
MTTWTVNSLIERRLLVNYRISPEYAAPLIPEPLRPLLVSGHAVGGLCFIRLGQIRLSKTPRILGFTTENVAHRFAVEWDDADGTHTGVYIPRRDTDSWITSAVGGRAFPGLHHPARFRAEETGGKIQIDVLSRDHKVRIAVESEPAQSLKSDLFGSIDAAVEFFRNAAVGFSPAAGGEVLEGVRLECSSWVARPMTITGINSSLFDDTSRFPSGACILDSALVMQNLPASWVTCPSLRLIDRAA